VADWTWVRERAVLMLHDAQVAEHGGAPGLRDLGLLRSALARPESLAAYGNPDAAALVAAYA
jgi:death-on-curing protein